MAAITIRNIPEDVHDALRHLAADRHQSVESLVRETLGEAVQRARRGGIDFGILARDRAAQGLIEDGPEWTDALDDPVLSRRVLGIDPPGQEA